MFYIITIIFNIFYHYDISLVALKKLLITGPSLIINLPHKIYYRFQSNKYPTIYTTQENILVMVHGRNGNPNDFLPLINNINTTHYFMTTLDLGENGESSIEEDANKIKNLISIYNHKNITLIGLSKGGLSVLYYYMTFNDYRIKKIITISSPLQGTYVTEFLPKDTVTYKELRHGSDISKQINLYDFDIPIYHIVPNYDYLIIPAASSTLISTSNDYVFYDQGYHSHNDITYSIDVSGIISKWINK